MCLTLPVWIIILPFYIEDRRIQNDTVFKMLVSDQSSPIIVFIDVKWVLHLCTIVFSPLVCKSVSVKVLSCKKQLFMLRIKRPIMTLSFRYSGNFRLKQVRDIILPNFKGFLFHFWAIIGEILQSEKGKIKSNFF